MFICDKLLNKEVTLSVIGLGYVGMPLAVSFSKRVKVIGFDIDKKKIELYERGIDPTNEVGDEAVKSCSVEFTYDERVLQTAKFHIVAVPTPITQDKTPDLDILESACVILGRNLTKNCYVVFESTVYPGVTEEVCVPILEKESSLKCGVDFKVGYSPERINPGDEANKLENIVKVVSGMDDESLEAIATVYELIIDAGVHRAPSIKVAEAAKVVENSQRDLNIAFINEMSLAFHKMGIDTMDVVKAMNTKWNALGFVPGLVGGHCIGVDPYYFIYMTEKLGFHSSLVASARRTNDGMSQFVVDNTIRKLILAKKDILKSKVAIFGITFKENCPDPRNSKVVDIVVGLKQYGIQPMVVDPVADKQDVFDEYGIVLSDLHNMYDLDCIIVAVAHDCFKELSLADISALFTIAPDSEKVIIDIKSLYERDELNNAGFSYWRL